MLSYILLSLVECNMKSKSHYMQYNVLLAMWISLEKSISFYNAYLCVSKP